MAENSNAKPTVEELLAKAKKTRRGSSRTAQVLRGQNASHAQMCHK
jgi:hypothetical protein